MKTEIEALNPWWDGRIKKFFIVKNVKMTNDIDAVSFIITFKLSILDLILLLQLI